MHVWVVKVGEPLPIDGTSYRPHRIGMLADALLSRGHEVTWWSSTLNHQSKQYRCTTDASFVVRDGYRINLVHSIGYEHNVSVRRLVDHAQLGTRFKRQIESAAKPDLIFCCFPTIAVAGVAAEYGRRHNIPVFLDVRDLWPGIFLNVVPKCVRRLAAMALVPYERKTRRAFQECTGVVGISESYLQYGLRYAGRQRTEMDGLFPLGFQRPEVDNRGLQGAHQFLMNCGVDRSKMICWFAGMFGRTYDLDTVIDAARQLSRQGIHDIQFVFSGAGESRSALETRARGLTNVVFTGRINAAQLAAMAEIADIGLMAYADGAPQSMPNKLYEYMCAGLTIVSSLRGETEIFLRERRCGFSYRAGDANSLAKIIAALRDNRALRSTTGENGRTVFDSEYSAEIIYSRLAGFLERLGSDYRDRQVELPRSLAETAIRVA